VHEKEATSLEKRAPVIRTQSHRQFSLAEFDWPFQTKLDEENRKPLGRSEKVTEENKAELKRLSAQRRAEYLQRIPIEGKFGQGKNGYRLNCIRATRTDTSAAWISSTFLVMNLLILREVFYWLLKKGRAGLRNWIAKLVETGIGEWPARVQRRSPMSEFAALASL